jgi:hypothetical protein
MKNSVTTTVCNSVTASGSALYFITQKCAIFLCKNTFSLFRSSRVRGWVLLIRRGATSATFVVACDKLYSRWVM